MRFQPYLVVIAALMLQLTLARQSAGQAASALQRLPGTANAVMSVDIARLIESPIGRKMNWQSKIISASTDRPIAVPPTTRRITIAAGVHPGEVETIWTAAILELPAAPNLEKVFQAQGGYIDEISGRKVLWTPRDTLYIGLDGNMLGVLRPAQRQYAARWLSSATQTGMTPYCRKSFDGAKDADVLLAIDLTDAISLAAVQYAYEMGRLPSLEEMKDSRMKLMRALADVKGLRLKVKAAEALDSELTIEFDLPVGTLGTNAGAFIKDVLKQADLYEPTVEAWTFRATGSTIVGTGQLQPESLARLMAMLSPPSMHESVASEHTPSASTPETSTQEPAPAPAGNTPTASAGQQSPAQASLQYYKTINATLDSLRMQSNLDQSRGWLLAKAKVIEQMPILNVDPTLVDWGTSVVQAFRAAAVELATGNQRAQLAAQGVVMPPATHQRTDDDFDADYSTFLHRDAQRQRRAVSMAERNDAIQKAIEHLKPVMDSRAQIRREMVQRYGIEF
jgi:hypothetical protein